jgi:hypothetical protein
LAFHVNVVNFSRVFLLQATAEQHKDFHRWQTYRKAQIIKTISLMFRKVILNNEILHLAFLDVYMVELRNHGYSVSQDNPFF